MFSTGFGPARQSLQRRRLGGRGLRLAVTVVALAGMLAACTSPKNSSNSNHEATKSGKPSSGGTVAFAEPPGETPNWILPFINTAAYNYLDDFQWNMQMWRYAYFPGGANNAQINYADSLALKPVFSNNNTTVAVTLKPWNWSDGTPITARNLLFFFNLLKAEKLNWWLYQPGRFPDNVKSATVTSERTLTFQLTGPTSPQLFAQNDLYNLIPLPLAWDRTSMSGDHGAGSTLPKGSGQGLDMTPAGAKSVYNFLIAQNKRQSQYATNWLWQIVSGPFKLASYDVSGATSLVPNKAYGGTQPKISKLSFVPFTSATSEFAALRSGNSIDVGYTTYSTLSQQSALNGYQLSPWPVWAVGKWVLNYNNPKTGPIVKQLYIRQAMQSLIDQPTIIKQIYHGYAYKAMGPVPLSPASEFVSPYAKSFPYPYNPTHAVQLLKSHGWTVNPGGVTTCSQPGSGANQCGAGIPAGAQLSFSLLYSNAVPEDQTQALLQKSDFSKAGIQLNLRPVSFGTWFTDVTPCTSSQSGCSWELGSWPQDFSEYGYPYAAIGLQTGAVYNFGSYSDPKADALLNAAAKASETTGLSPELAQSNDYLTQQLGELYQPAVPYQLTEVRSNLQGVTPQNPQIAIAPEHWYYTK